MEYTVLNLEEDNYKIIITPLREDDIINRKEESMLWFKDPEVTKWTSHGRFPHLQHHAEAYFDTVKNSRTEIVWAIQALRQKKKQSIEILRHIGNITLQSIDWVNRTAELAIIIGNKEFWGKGIASKAGFYVIKHAFEKLNLHKVWLGTPINNNAMCRAAINMGMKFEAALEEIFYHDGYYHDVFIYSILQGTKNKH